MTLISTDFTFFEFLQADIETRLNELFQRLHSVFGFAFQDGWTAAIFARPSNQGHSAPIFILNQQTMGEFISLTQDCERA